MSDLFNQYGIAIDYIQLIEDMHIAGVDRGVQLKMDIPRNPHSIGIHATTLIKGVDYHCTVELIPDYLMSENRVQYLRDIAGGVARELGYLVFLRRFNE